MSAFNVVRMRAKPGRVDELRRLSGASGRCRLPGMTALAVVQTGERDFCVIGEWTGMEALVAARPAMVAALDQLRDKLEDLGGGLGVDRPGVGRGGACDAASAVSAVQQAATLCGLSTGPGIGAVRQAGRRASRLPAR